ncbi:hypothetical protein [Carboxylicivirga sp. RSCT41]|uniref:hypothetical protein n=1 Tax=Carboxylicivirga agarovorans TaxID=3417570 RepID=UPI003D32FEE4
MILIDYLGAIYLTTFMAILAVFIRISIRVKKKERVYMEHAILEGKATVMFSKDKVRGMLFLTDSNLTFKSLDNNVELDFDLGDLSEKRVNTMWKLLQQFLIISNEKNDFRIKVKYPEDWKAIILYKSALATDTKGA